MLATEATELRQEATQRRGAKSAMPDHKDDRNGAGPDEVLAAAATDPIKSRLKDHVREAQERGLFGAPSFLTADGELFWGNDRLEQALDWAVRHQSLEHA